ncbi:MAG: PKD repeat protein [Bacteroidia bacterium]|jgi:PKD repeat protein
MKKTTLLFLSLALILGISSCKEDDTPVLGAAPTEADAAFTYAPTAANANIIDYTATNAGFTYSWNFDNGTNAATKEATAEYPNKGTYTVTLTVFNSGGSASTSQDIIIADDDASLLNNPLYTLLTGGTAGSGSKTWVIDSTRQAHLGVGPVAGTWPEWWDADPGAKANSGLYSDKYTFSLSGFGFDHVTNGLVFVKTGSQGQFPGSYENSDDWSAPFSDQLNENWTIVEGEDTTISISGKAFLGMYTGVREYKIVTLSENELTVRYVDVADPTTAWYLRLVPEDFPVDGGGGGGGVDPVNTSILTLPIDFEDGSDTSQWEAFGESTLAVVDNPQTGGINSSSKVLETVHGSETWAGVFVNLKDKFDFMSGSPTITLKVWAPVTGNFKVKMENFAKPTENTEKDITVDTANEWVEISVDFSDIDASKFDRLVLFPGWNVSNAGTFYLDDISQK